jgi:hypothetical protein
MRPADIVPAHPLDWKASSGSANISVEMFVRVSLVGCASSSAPPSSRTTTRTPAAADRNLAAGLNFWFATRTLNGVAAQNRVDEFERGEARILHVAGHVVLVVVFVDVRVRAAL